MCNTFSTVLISRKPNLCGSSWKIKTLSKFWFLCLTIFVWLEVLFLASCHKCIRECILPLSPRWYSVRVQRVESRIVKWNGWLQRLGWILHRVDCISTSHFHPHFMPVIQGVSKCSPWLQTFITRKPKNLSWWNCSQPQENWKSFFFWQLEIFDVCTTGVTAHVDACVARTWISYRCVPCHPWCTHEHL